MTDRFRAAFDALPEGSFDAIYDGRRYVVAKTRFAQGRSHKLEAWERGGTDYISLNLYDLSSGKMVLNPCEMPAENVRRFVERVRPE
ncbi:hypothetical protein [Palleronia pelagia]|uniref:Uncharacterized protein n=1 Tax=Palleronia pelagia TaxID=387096 RepID=A0A1H8EK20_9RHOB|nr:hypothetical protein [Palleronia pelagia]SEN19730.1 hypothetical protein SAMN04488011_1036 [Palleronia pelagia]